jgi:hypothetical protein
MNSIVFSRKKFMEDEIGNLLPITPITQEFKDEKELTDFANEFPLKVIAHNLFCIAEFLNMQNNLLAYQIDKNENKPKLSIRPNPNAKWIYERKN